MSDGFTRIITHFFRWLFVLLCKPSGKPLSSEQFSPYFHYSYSVSIHCSWSLLDEFARVCPSFSFDEHSVDFVRSRIEFRPCNPGIRITPSSSDRCKQVRWNRGKWTRTSGSSGFCFSRMELFIFYNGGWSARCSERFIFRPERNGIGIHRGKMNRTYIRTFFVTIIGQFIRCRKTALFSYSGYFDSKIFTIFEPWVSYKLF